MSLPVTSTVLPWPTVGVVSVGDDGSGSATVRTPNAPPHGLSAQWNAQPAPGALCAAANAIAADSANDVPTGLPLRDLEQQPAHPIGAVIGATSLMVRAVEVGDRQQRY